MKIGEMADLVGISAPTIRYYESIGLVTPPERESGWRQYSEADLERLKVVHAARDVGFSIEETRDLVIDFPKGDKPSARWQQLAKNKLPELDRVIENTRALKFLIEAGMDCACDDIALCINSSGQACRPGTVTLTKKHR